MGRQELIAYSGGTPPTVGRIIYIKATVLGTEPLDILGYSKETRSHPQESTTYQWFGETQFESYAGCLGERQLGPGCH